MRKFWSFLQGKKTSIATISGAILVYCLNNGVIGSEEAQLISIILMALGLTANVGNAIIANRK